MTAGRGMWREGAGGGGRGAEAARGVGPHFSMGTYETAQAVMAQSVMAQSVIVIFRSVATLKDGPHFSMVAL